MKKALMAVPSFIASGVAALPVLTCPACWPLYAGLLGALGLGFVDYTPYLLPVTAALLVLSLVPLKWKAKQRWGYNPLIAGILGAALILAGKFWIDYPALFYVGVALLLAASVWNIWPVKASACIACEDP